MDDVLDLLDFGDIEKREKLIARGWRREQDGAGKWRLWRRPDGAQLTEEQAFVSLDRILREEAQADAEQAK